MKEKLVGRKNKNFGKKDSTYWQTGFSTLELMISFSIISIVLVGAVGANFTAQYWQSNSETANEGLYKAKTRLEDLRSLIKQDFYQVTSTPLLASVDPLDPADASCISGGLCYFVEDSVTDLSSCSKYVEVKVEWQISNYPKINTTLFTNLTNSPEIISKGGDCILNEPEGDWRDNPPQNAGLLSFTPGKQFTGIDVLHNKIYTTGGVSPYFFTFTVPTGVGNPPSLVSYSNGFTLSKRANSLDVEEDLSTGRTYAFVAMHATTSQLIVLDMTDNQNPTVAATRSLTNVDPFGSFPHGWRVFIYGARLYMTVRETTGTEFHIFDISTPTLPTEIGNGFELNRTVNQIVVREQKVAGVKKKLAFLASDSNLKEIGILDVTNDVIAEINSTDLPGDQDGFSIFLLGNNLFFGRMSNPSGPELYVFDTTDPSANLLSHIIGQGEVGSNVTNIQVSGDYAYFGTARAGEEFQVWNSNFTLWNPGTLNSGRFQKYSFPNLSPLGFDIEKDWIYLINNSAGSDSAQVLYTP